VLLAAHGIEDDVGAVALVAGTAIGGGFLALPASTGPAGCLPSALLLLGASGALLAEAYIVADLVIDISKQEGRPVSLSTCARRTLGGPAGATVEALFVLLMCSTLVSQFAKGGSLLSGWLGLPYQAGCALVAASLSLFSLSAPRPLISQVNARLAAGFAVSLAIFFACGAPLADWTALYRADWPAAYGSAPTILQLLVYNEIVPTVCALLKFDRRRVRRALGWGAALLLLILSSWSALGICLAAAVGSGAVGVSALGAGAVPSDPVAMLLSSRSALGGSASVLAACAVSTTVLATNLALQTLFTDLADRSVQSSGSATAPPADKRALVSETSSPSEANQASRASRSRGWWRLGALPLSLLASLICASLSPDAFFGAIDFAGAYPVALLWGVAPPVMALAAARRQGNRLRPRTVVGLVGLGLAALLFVGSNAATDIGRLLVHGAGGAARWQRW
jgi:amino acid permease